MEYVRIFATGASTINNNHCVIGNVTVYEGVGHGFMNESPEPYATEKAKDEGFEAIGFDKTFYPYDADVANAAWGSLFDFFEKYL